MTPGIHTLPAESLPRRPGADREFVVSIAKVLITQSPLHAWYQHPRLNPNFQSDHDSRFDIGSAAHAYAFVGKA